MATVSLALLIGKSKIGIGPSDPKVLSGLIAAVTGGTELSGGPARGGRHCSGAVNALLAITANSFDLRSYGLPATSERSPPTEKPASMNSFSNSSGAKY